MLFFLYSYCNRRYGDEKSLSQHQKAKHFKCDICREKFENDDDFSIHFKQMHEQIIDKIQSIWPYSEYSNTLLNKISQIKSKSAAPIITIQG